MNPISGKKILFVITKSNWGGAQAYVYTLATALKERGAEVVVALGGTGLPGAEKGLLAERLEAAGVRTIFLKSFMRDISITHELKAGFELLKILKQERPDILHLNSSKAGGIGALAGRLASIRRVIFTVHGWPQREPRPFPVRAVFWISMWATIFLSHAVIAVSKLDYDTSPVFFSKKKIKLVYNGIAPFELLSRETARAALAEKGITSRLQTWILMISELTRNKAIDIAIRAFARIKDKFPDAILVDFGEGELREELTKLIASEGLAGRVFLPGFVADGKKYLQAGDIFLMSSYKEGFPMTLLEAGIAQVPVIATGTGGIPELIEDSKTGLLFTPGDVEMLAAKLEDLLSHKAEGESLAESLHARVLADFSAEKMAGRTIAVYSD